jgi:hypothetical protein
LFADNGFQERREEDERSLEVVSKGQLGFLILPSCFNNEHSMPSPCCAGLMPVYQ